EAGCFTLIGAPDGGAADSLPEWVLDALVDPRFEPFTKWCERLGATVPESDLACAALRTLLIHHWRRLVLKRSASAPHLQVLTGEASARRAVAAAYQRLSPKADTWFDAAVGAARLNAVLQQEGSFRRV
ncbi:MAG: hypothetical protein AAGM04_05000, partial [Pseudomonadota bacterium]